MLSQEVINSRFESVRQEVDKRWNLFVGAQNFPLYHPNWTKTEVEAEYQWVQDLRRRYWQEPLFKTPQVLLDTERYREPDCITFEHSATDETYNSTCIEVGKRRFLALEAPKENTVGPFLQLLTRWRVASLVCLTNEADPDGKPKCHPYWKTRMIGEDQTLCLSTHGRKIPYINWPDWIDNCGTCPKKLSLALKQACHSLPKEEIMAVHCSAGVGRTGTFISSVCLFDQIEEQKKAGKSPKGLEISIPKLLLYLNLYRPRLVSNLEQYLTLYQTVDQLNR